MKKSKHIQLNELQIKLLERIKSKGGIEYSEAKEMMDKELDDPFVLSLVIRYKLVKRKHGVYVLTEKGEKQISELLKI